jgi:cell fate regulator YaaT (PSP1 superfamily)
VLFRSRQQCLWFNKNIKINKKEIKWNSWIQHGINLLHDILDRDGKFISITTMEELFNYKCDVMKYNSLKDAIPKEWREKVKQIKIDRMKY